MAHSVAMARPVFTAVHGGRHSINNFCLRQTIIAFTNNLHHFKFFLEQSLKELLHHSCLAGLGSH